MFHTYVRARSGNMVDFDRAMVLMDSDLFADSFDAMWRERGSGEWTDDRAAQCVWDHYCRSHAARYGEPFVPDINPTWDRSATEQEAQHLRTHDELADTLADYPQWSLLPFQQIDLQSLLADQGGAPPSILPYEPVPHESWPLVLLGRKP